ncbi:MAG: hypothetical protein GY707_17725 [Desulfobacteraceae bacterium]|nr:hypothetical protein [Desulfobacteraceae bacterium]
MADSLWNAPLSGKKNNVSDKDLTIGDYLLSASKFLEKDNFTFLKKGLNALLSCDVEIDEIEKIRICLEKHGPFYHPIKITCVLKNKKSALFVLNGAVSDIGLSTIEIEYQNLERLNFDTLNQGKLDSESYIPKVFGIDFIESDKGKIGFFLAQWFDGFEEFHVVQTENKTNVGLLKSDGSFSLIPDSKAIAIYKKASEILTFFYGITSLKQISPWHHAAGDFIVKISEDNVEVKLITIRGYKSLMESEDLFVGLFFFFLNLSLRMRVDRNKGTEEYMFLDESVVQSCVDGFIIGLKDNLKAHKKFSKSNPDFYHEFIKFLKDFDFEILLNAFIMIVGSYNKKAPEASIIEKNLEQHAKAVFQSIEQL